MPKLLVKYHGNWADEMDLNGFIIIEKEIWENHLERVKKFMKAAGPQRVSCGSNEDVDYSSFEDYKRSFKTNQLSNDEAARLKTLFGSEYGHFLAIRREGMYEHPDPSDDDENLEF